MSRIAEALTVMKQRGWRRAADVEGVGWQGNVCMHLALCEAYHAESDAELDDIDGFVKDLDAIGFVCQEQFPEAIRDPYATTAEQIWAVNDAEGRTFDEVERVMEKAYIARCSEIVD